MSNSRKIKICYVASVDITLKLTLFDYLKLAQKEGYDVYAVCSPGRWIKEIEKEGIKVKTITITRKMFTPFSDLIALIKLFLYFKKEKFDIVHTHTPKAGFLGRIAAKLAGVPIIIHANLGFLFHENSKFFERKFFIYLERIGAACCDSIISINKEDMETAVIEKICSKDKIKYSADAINVERFDPSKFSPEFIKNKKKEIGIREGEKVIGIIGRLVVEKGYVDMFEAMKIIIKDFKNAKLLIVGIKESQKKDFFDPELSAKKYDLEKNIIFLGERTDVEELYPLMDVSVLPSHREGLGRVTLEASLMERPVVATDIRGCREAVDDKKTGILVPVKNPEQLAKAVIYILNNPEKAFLMGKLGRVKVMAEFDGRLVFGRINQEYKRLINIKLPGLQNNNDLTKSA
jgi:glycosyltransferase involved in cell wall biosynthesis